VFHCVNAPQQHYSGLQQIVNARFLTIFEDFTVLIIKLTKLPFRSSFGLEFAKLRGDFTNLFVIKYKLLIKNAIYSRWIKYTQARSTPLGENAHSTSNIFVFTMDAQFNIRNHPKIHEDVDFARVGKFSQIMDLYDQIHQLNLVFFHNMMSRCYHILYRIQRRRENVSKREFKGGNQLNICLLLGRSIKIKNGDRLRFLKLFYDEHISEIVT